MGSGVVFFLEAAERVIGAKYVSPGSRLSDGVGEAAMIFGVPGTWYCCDMVTGSLRAMRNGGKEGYLIRPAT